MSDDGHDTDDYWWPDITADNLVKLVEHAYLSMTDGIPADERNTQEFKADMWVALEALCKWMHDGRGDEVYLLMPRLAELHDGGLVNLLAAQAVAELAVSGWHGNWATAGDES